MILNFAPDLTPFFLMAAVFALLAYLIGGVHWIAVGRGVRVWRALLVMLGIPLVVLAHGTAAVCLYSFADRWKLGGIAMLLWVFAPAPLTWAWIALNARDKRMAEGEPRALLVRRPVRKRKKGRRSLASPHP